MTQPGRHYDAELPYHIETMWLGFAITKLESEGLWDGLPDALKKKLKDGQSGWSGVDITEDDLNSIPDAVWHRLALLLKISWRQL